MNIRHNPDSFLKLSQQHIRSLLDEPSLVRREAPVTVWQYRNEACVLDLYFKGPLKDNFKSVIHYEVRPRDDAAMNETFKKSCVSDLLSEHEGFRMMGVNAFYKR